LRAMDVADVGMAGASVAEVSEGVASADSAAVSEAVAPRDVGKGRFVT